MKYLNKGILLDIILAMLIILNNIKLDFTLSNSILFGIIFIVYGIYLIISYLYNSETSDGENRVSYLVFGCIYLSSAPIIIALKDNFSSSIVLLFIFGIALLHSIGRIFIKKNRGIAIKIIQIVWSIIVIAWSIGLCLSTIYPGSIQDYISNVSINVCLMIALIVIDLVILVLSCVLPRTDLENKNVKIDYSSDEDQIFYKSSRKHRHHEEEVIDLDRLFKTENYSKKENI